MQKNRIFFKTEASASHLKDRSADVFELLTGVYSIGSPVVYSEFTNILRNNVYTYNISMKAKFDFFLISCSIKSNHLDQ